MTRKTFASRAEQRNAVRVVDIKEEAVLLLKPQEILDGRKAAPGIAAVTDISHGRFLLADLLQRLDVVVGDGLDPGCIGDNGLVIGERDMGGLVEYDDRPPATRELTRSEDWQCTEIGQHHSREGDDMSAEHLGERVFKVADQVKIKERPRAGPVH